MRRVRAPRARIAIARIAIARIAIARIAIARIAIARIAMALLVPLAGAACGGSEPTPPFADIEGTYVLETINGASPPIAIGGGNYLLEMSLTLGGDGRTIMQGYTRALQTSDVPTFRQFFSSEGRASRGDSLILFTDLPYVTNGTGRVPTPGELRVTSTYANLAGQYVSSSLLVFRKP